MKVFVSLDTKGYLEKPANESIPSIKYRIINNWGEVDLVQLADKVGNQGYTMVPAHLEGGISAKNFKEMQLFALDFDHGSSFQSIKKKCTDMGIEIAFAYHTFNSTIEEERFRIVFAFDCIIKERFVADVIQNMLIKIFPECDPQCKNLDRMFYGGRELIECNKEARINLVQLIFPFQEALNIDGHYKRNILKFSQKTNLLLFNLRPVMGRIEDLNSLFGEKIDSTIIYIIGKSTKSPTFIAQKDGLHSNITCKLKMKRIPIKENGCNLLDDFINGNKLSHIAKFAILTNLLYVIGGKKKFLNVINNFYGLKSYEKWCRDVQYIKNYHPQRCSEEFCPYYHNCDNVGTILNTLLADQKIYCKEETLYPIEEAQAYLVENLENAFRYGGEGIHLIKAQTAIGKTTAYINLIKENPENKFIIALPTNRLKQQVAKDLEYAGLLKNEIFVTPSIQESGFFSSDMIEEIVSAHTRGIHNKTTEIVSTYYQEIKDDPCKMAIVEECERIMNGLNHIQDERVIVTTHAFFVQMQEEFLKQYTVIIDEDILQLQLLNKVNTISIECLNELASKGYSGYSSIAKEMIQAPQGVYQKVCVSSYLSPLSEIQLDDMEHFGSEDNINDLAYAGSFVKLQDQHGEIIKYFCVSKLPRMKYIVLSATLNENIYNLYFLKDMKVYTYPEKKASYKGKLVQYTYHSLGRRDLLSKQQVFSFAKERLPGCEIITFKRFEECNSTDLHFGNTTGINALSGRNLVIVGTPFKVEEAYKLVACYLGADVNQKVDEIPRKRRIDYKNYNFVIVTYDDPLLREVQLYSIESELEQCIGRARLLRKDCTVYLFSSFPCEQAELHTKNYLLRENV